MVRTIDEAVQFFLDGVLEELPLESRRRILFAVRELEGPKVVDLFEVLMAGSPFKGLVTDDTLKKLKKLSPELYDEFYSDLRRLRDMPVHPSYL